MTAMPLVSSIAAPPLVAPMAVISFASLAVHFFIVIIQLDRIIQENATNWIAWSSQAMTKENWSITK